MADQPWVCGPCRAGDCLACDIMTAHPVEVGEPVPVCACLHCHPERELPGTPWPGGGGRGVVLAPARPTDRSARYLAVWAVTVRDAPTTP
jgi:hypothetical protein